MDAIQVKLTALWVALMLVYLLGDVLRIFSGDFTPGEIMGTQVSLAFNVLTVWYAWQWD